jgi:hypothetical protein
LIENNNIKKCKNCGVDLVPGAKYCHQCGQITKEKKISLKYIFSDFFNNFFNFDFKILKTLKALLIPGKLTKEYFQGKYTSYSSPWRLFFITIVLMLIIINIVGKIKSIKKIEPQSKSELSLDYIPKKGFHFKLAENTKNLDTSSAQIKINEGDTILDNLPDIIKSGLKNTFVGKSKRLSYNELDSILPDSMILLKISGIFASYDSAFVYSDSTMMHILDTSGYLLNKYIKEAYRDSTQIFNDIKVSIFDLKHLDFEKLKNKYNINTKQYGYLKSVFYKWVYILNSKDFDSAKLIDFMLKNLNWFIILLLPFAALIFKLIYIRQKKYYVEHLIFNLHNHTAILVLFTIYTLGNLIDNDIVNNLMGYILAFGPAVYYIISMHNYYKQSLTKTIFKFFAFSFIYFIVLLIAFIGYSVIATLAY